MVLRLIVRGSIGSENLSDRIPLAGKSVAFAVGSVAVTLGALIPSIGASSTLAFAVRNSSLEGSNTEVVALGHRLFLDPRLSPDGSIKCASCHEPAHSFSDGRRVSVGFDHRAGTRNTPSLLNIFPGEPLFWDGRRTQLDVAVLDPLVNRVEMGNPNFGSVIARLKARAVYRAAFSNVFHEGNRSISTASVGAALAAYIRSLPRPPNAYDRFKAGQTDALSPQARAGLQLFTGRAGCARCHEPANGRFTDDRFHHSGVGLDLAQNHLGTLTIGAMRRDLTGSALGSAIGGNAQMAALGRFLVTHQASDVGAFRTPSLRNVALTAPYMHDGSIKTLSAAVDAEIYYRGLATGKPVALTAEEREDLLVFLRSLTSSPQSRNDTKQPRYAAKL